MVNLDYIKIYDNVINKGECNYYINLINNADKKTGKIYNEQGDSCINIAIKHSEDVCLSVFYPNDINNLLKLFCEYIELYEKDIAIKIPILKHIEFITGRIYKKKIGFYKPHIDADGPNSASRCLSILLYLNTVKYGGELVFPHQDKLISAKAGRLVIFPSTWQYVHGANMPISNDRYILRTFVTSC